jgi:hypothetical protein
MRDLTVPSWPYLTPQSRLFVAGVLATYGGVLQTPVTLLDGGMENARSPYLLLGTARLRHLFLVERRNDAGERDALFYDAHESVDLLLHRTTLEALADIGEADQALTEHELVDRGLLRPGADDTWRDMPRILLYGFRDVIAPGSVPPWATT